MTLREGRLVLALWSVLALAGCRGESEREREAAPGQSAAVVALTPRELAVVDVKTETAAVATVPETFNTTGEIEFDPARLVTVNVAVAGRIRRLRANVGDHVAAGDTVATIESPEFLSGAFPVTAPRGGVVTSLGAAPQQLVTSGAELLRIASIDRVWLRVDLYGESAQLARAGSAVEASVGALPGVALRGRIATVAPSVEGATQTVTARVPLENPSGRLLPGMFADVRVMTGRTFRGILVPRAAIIYDGSRRLVMIAQDSTYFPSVVIIGPVVGDRVVVLRGVNPGERLVVQSAYELFSAGYAFIRGGGEEGEGEKRK
jgi:multidrug efflux pump subunit AcrA (membrane-fusion protein)